MKGGCHCGNIRFEVKGKPLWTGFCHCSDCKKISGSVGMGFVEYNLKNFNILKGKPTEYKSSKKVKRSFCDRCGSPITYSYIFMKKYKDKIYIPLGIFDNSKNFGIKEHIFVSQKLPWIHIHSNISQDITMESK